MTASFDLDFVAFHCKHSECGEVFEKSLGDLAGTDEAICPRCGTAAHIGAENHLLVAAKAAQGLTPLDKTTG